MISRLSGKLIPLYREMHEGKRYRGGSTLRKYTADIAQLVTESGTRTILDYGCQPRDAKVLTPDGWREIGTIGIGDYVMGAAGRPVLVSGMHSPGCVEVYRVHFSDGTSLVVDGNHLWSVRTSNHQKRQQPFGVRSTKDLIASELSWRNDNWTHRPLKWRIPMVEPVEFRSGSTLPIDPYLLGVLLGDGSFRLNNVEFTSALQAIVDHVIAVLPPGIELVKTPKPGNAASNYRIVRSDGRGCRWIENPIKAAIKALGLDDVIGYEKFVPRSYLLAPVKDRVSLLAGLLDTDGEIGLHVSYATSSQQLADDVVFLAQSLGCNAFITAKEKPRYQGGVGRPCFTVHIKPARGLRLTRAKPWPERQEYHANRLISAIEPAGKEDVIGITVDALDRLYVTEHFIVTHNCGKGMQYEEDGLHETWGGILPTLFDPAVPGIDVLPDGQFDGVICTGVLEHIPGRELPMAFENLARYARKWCFLAIGISLAHKTLPNGQNAHVTVKTPEWWMERIEPYFEGGAQVHYRWVSR